MTCLYCNSSKKSKEHVFSEKLGCMNYVRNVCEPCNNEALSKLDTAFLDTSPVVFINSFRRFHGDPAFFWGVDESLQNLMIEGYYDDQLSTLYVYPQLILFKDSFQIRGDANDMNDYGEENFKKLLLDRAIESLENKKGARYINQSVDQSLIETPYSFPPRVFSTSLERLIKGKPLYSRFTESQNEILMNILKSKKRPSLNQVKYVEGPSNVRYYVKFVKGTIQRAIYKFGLNFISYSCKKTKVDYNSFRETARIVSGNWQGLRVRRDQNAFPTIANCFEKKAVKENEHYVRLSHIKGLWHFIMSFFGNKFYISATIEGPCNEDWRTIEYRIPIGVKDWERETFMGAIPISGIESWEVHKVLPTVKMPKSSTVKLPL